MREQKIVVCHAEYASREIQSWLDRGWKVKFCVAEQVASTDNSTRGYNVVKGNIIFILDVE